MFQRFKRFAFWRFCFARFAFRAFQRRFALGPGLTVTSATVADGIIEIVLERPELREAGVEIDVLDRGA